MNLNLKFINPKLILSKVIYTIIVSSFIQTICLIINFQVVFKLTQWFNGGRVKR